MPFGIGKKELRRSRLSANRKKSRESYICKSVNESKEKRDCGKKKSKRRWTWPSRNSKKNWRGKPKKCSSWKSKLRLALIPPQLMQFLRRPPRKKIKSRRKSWWRKKTCLKGLPRPNFLKIYHECQVFSKRVSWLILETWRTKFMISAGWTQVNHYLNSVSLKLKLQQGCKWAMAWTKIRLVNLLRHSWLKLSEKIQEIPLLKAKRLTE